MQLPPGCRVPRQPLPLQEQGCAPQQEAAPGPQLLLGRKCCWHPSTPAPLLPVPLRSHRSCSIFLESSRHVPSVLEDKNKAAVGVQLQGGMWHRAPHQPTHRRRDVGSAFVLYLAPSLSHKLYPKG